MKFTVERSKWLRGEGVAMSWLLRKGDDKMCCLGFVCAQSGVPKHFLVGVDAPSGLAHDALEHADGLIGLLLTDDAMDTTLVTDAIGLNDDRDISDGDRERRLAWLFACHGHDLEFVP